MWWTWCGLPGFLSKRLSFLDFHMHHIKVRMFGRDACGWFIFRNVIRSWVRELQFRTRIWERINQGVVNQAALAKLHVKNKWISSSSMPYLEHSLLMCLEYFPTLAPVGIAFLSNLHPKAWTRGVICLFFQIWFCSCIVWGCTCRRLGSPCSCKYWRHARYALLDLHLPDGVNFQQRMSFSWDWIMYVLLIMEAMGCWNSVSISWLSHAFWFGIQRSLTWVGKRKLQVELWVLHRCGSNFGTMVYSKLKCSLGWFGKSSEL